MESHVLRGCVCRGILTVGSIGSGLVCRAVFRLLRGLQTLSFGIHIGHQLVAGDGFLLQKVQRHLVEKLAVLAQNCLRLLIAASSSF